MRDSFPSHSSSPSKANLGIEVTRWSKISITFAIHTSSQNPFGEGRMAHIKWPHLLSLLKSVLPAFSQRSTRWTSAPLRAVSSLKLSTRIHPITGWHWLFPSSYPTPPTACLTVSLPKGEGMGLPRSTYLTSDTLGPPYLPAGVLPVSDVLKSIRTTHLPFWSKPYSSFGLFTFTTVASVHLR